MTGALEMLRPLTDALPAGSTQIWVFVLTTLCVGALLTAFQPKSARERLDVRLRSVSPAGASGAKEEVDSDRRRLVEDAIRELQSKEKSKEQNGSRPTLVTRLRQAGLAWSRHTYLLVSALTGCASFLFFMSILGLGLIPSLGFGAAGGLLLPHFYLGVVRARRMKAFSAEFPNALDTIVRGVQAGIPLSDALRTIASEAQAPVRTEFGHVVHDLALGLSLEAALQRLAARVPLSEASFFAIVLAVQAKTGGNLSEALSNLSGVLRDRSKMRMKIRAMSSEAKASAGIIGSLPIAVAGLLYLTSPDYIELLFTTSIGHLAIAGSLVWMLMGCLVMRKMINFDF